MGIINRTKRMIPWGMVATGAAMLAWGVRRRNRRISFRDLSVVISGGSRGLGLELARQLGAEGAKLVLLARDAGELDRAQRDLYKAGADVLSYSCDIRNREDVERTMASVIRAQGKIDVLINVAGTIQVAPFENLDLDDYRESFNIYGWGPLHMIRAVVPHMQQRKSGRIVNITSIGGLVAIPHLLSYCMGKFALTALSDGLRAELAKDGIMVTTVAPGLMRTGSHINAMFKGQHRKEFAWFSLSNANPLLSISAPKAAQRIIEACRFGDARLVITVPAKVLHLSNALFPGLTSFGAGVAARLLPSPARTGGERVHAGWESCSRMAPSFLTRMSDRQINYNNEL